MRLGIFISLTMVALINASCSENLGTHAIQCLEVNERKVCFVREVWGFNGDGVSLTVSNDVCHKPSKENDYVSDSMRSSEVIFVKIIDKKLHIYSESMDMPKNKFPVDVVFEKYNPTGPDRNLLEEGYQPLDLSKKMMTWCFNDVF